MKRALMAVLGLVLLGGIGFAIWRFVVSPKAPVVEYKTSPVERKRLVAQVTASGTLSARVTVQVGSQVSGRVQEILVDWNSQVKKGQLIARIDPQLFQATLEQANANYLSAKAQVVKAEVQVLNDERIYARAKALAAQSLAGQAEVDAAETTAKVSRAQVDVTKAALAQAQASLNQAQVNLSYTRIISPIDGIVISRSVDVGQTVAASLSAPVLFTIAEDLRKMQLDTNVAESDVGRMEAGQSAQFSVDAYPGRKFYGEIAMIRNAPQTVQNVVTYDAVLAVDNADLKLRPGMTANISIVYQERDNALVVPNAALRFKPPGDAGAPPSGSGSVGPIASSGAPASPPTLSQAALPSTDGSDAGSTDGGNGRHRRHGDGGPGATDGGSAEAPLAEGDKPRGDWRGGNGRGENRGPKRVYVLRGLDLIAVDVRTGISDGTSTEILSGELKEGDLVVTDAIVPNAKPAATGVPGMGGGGMGGGGAGGSGGGGRRSGI